MAWTYSGNPSTNEIDKYRFLISDTDHNDPVLQDEEINYLLSEYSEHNVRLYHLFDRAADIFARKVSNKLGPQSEFTNERTLYFKEKAKYYRALISTSSGLTLPKGTKIFTKGMHDNV